jgi:hypothetical protein
VEAQKAKPVAARATKVVAKNIQAMLVHQLKENMKKDKQDNRQINRDQTTPIRDVKSDGQRKI